MTNSGDGVIVSETSGASPSKPLTHKMRRFAQLVADGSTLSGAYAQVYSVENSLPATIRKEASTLANHPRVQSLIVELKADDSVSGDTQSLITGQWVEQELYDVAKNAKNETTRLRALDLLGRATGLFSGDDVFVKPRSSGEIKKDIVEKLEKLGILSQDKEDEED